MLSTQAHQLLEPAPISAVKNFRDSPNTPPPGLCLVHRCRNITNRFLAISVPEALGAVSDLCFLPSGYSLSTSVWLRENGGEMGFVGRCNFCHREVRIFGLHAAHPMFYRLASWKDTLTTWLCFNLECIFVYLRVVCHKCMAASDTLSS